MEHCNYQMIKYFEAWKRSSGSPASLIFTHKDPPIQKL